MGRFARLAYADLLVQLRRAGMPLPTNDIWIGATATSHGATVITFDAHFQHMPTVASQIFEKRS